MFWDFRTFLINIKTIIFIIKHISISTNSLDKFNLNIFKTIDEISPIIQKRNRLLYLKFCFVQVFNIIFANPIDTIENIIKNKYPSIPNFRYGYN